MSVPYPGEVVDVEIVDVDEIEATCYITNHDVNGYIDNKNMRFKVEDIGDQAVFKIAWVDESGYISLKHVEHYLD